MAGIKRLQSFYPFDTDILTAISRVAGWQNKKTFAELAEYYSLDNILTVSHPFGDKHALEYIQLTPRNAKDEAPVRVLFAPMGTAADQNMAMRAFRLAAVLPDKPLWVVGNPASIGRRTNLIALSKLKAVWSGDLRLVVEPLLKELQAANISCVDFLGYSYGADLAASAAGLSKEYGIIAEKVVLAEPASIEMRGMRRLFKSFIKAFSPLEGYIRATESMPLREARDLTKITTLQFLAKLLRGSNVAIGHALSKDGFEGRVSAALSEQPGLRAVMVWGTKSELSNPVTMQRIVTDLQRAHGNHRILPLVMNGMHHAGGDDIDLHAAMVAQGLKAS